MQRRRVWVQYVQHHCILLHSLRPRVLRGGRNILSRLRSRDEQLRLLPQRGLMHPVSGRVHARQRHLMRPVPDRRAALHDLLCHRISMLCMCVRILHCLHNIVRSVLAGMHVLCTRVLVVLAVPAGVLSFGGILLSVPHVELLLVLNRAVLQLQQWLCSKFVLHSVLCVSDGLCVLCADILYCMSGRLCVARLIVCIVLSGDFQLCFMCQRHCVPAVRLRLHAANFNIVHVLLNCHHKLQHVQLDKLFVHVVRCWVLHGQLNPLSIVFVCYPPLCCMQQCRNMHSVHGRFLSDVINIMCAMCRQLCCL